MKSRMVWGGVAAALSALSAVGADGVLNVSGTVDWADSANWEGGVVADRGGATLKGGGTVNLAVGGTGALELAFADGVEAEPGLYEVMTFGSLAAEDAARLRTWSVTVSGLPAKYRASVSIVNNAVYVAVAPKGTVVLFR